MKLQGWQIVFLDSSPHSPLYLLIPSFPLNSPSGDLKTLFQNLILQFLKVVHAFSSHSLQPISPFLFYYNCWFSGLSSPLDYKTHTHTKGDNSLSVQL